MQGQTDNNEGVIWGDFTVKFTNVQNSLHIYLNDNTNGKQFNGVHQFDNLPDKIKHAYGEMDLFLSDINYILTSKIQNRLKIKKDGHIIFYIKHQVAGQIRFIQQILTTQEKQIDVDPEELVKIIQNFQADKCKKTKQIKQIYEKINQLDSLLKIQQVKKLKELEQRVTLLENDQHNHKFGDDQKETQKMRILEKTVANLQVQLKNCIKKRTEKMQTQTKMNLMSEETQNQITDMGAEQAFIDGYYLTFQLKNHYLLVNLLNKEKVQKYEILITKNDLKDSTVKNPQMLFRQIAYILRSEPMKDRISIKNGCILNIRLYTMSEGKQTQTISKFQAKKVQFNQIQKLQKMIEITKKEFEPLKSFSQTAEKLIKDQKDWIQKQLKVNQIASEKFISQQMTEINKSLQMTKVQIFGVDKNEKMGKQSVKALNLPILHNLILTQKDQLNSFVNSFTEQIKQMNLQRDFMIKKKINQQDFKLAHRLSNILQTEKQCETLFKFFSKKVDHIRLMFKASQHGFSNVQFHQICDHVPNTLVLIKTQFGKVIGGYTPLKWDKSIDNYTQDTSLTSFIFSLTNGDKFTDSNTGHSICNDPNYGPTFGGGNDIYICNQSNTSNCFSQHCHTYKNANYKHNNQQSWTKFQGSTASQYFKTIQYQVYQVIFV